MNRCNSILFAKCASAVGAACLSVLTCCDEPAQSSRPTTNPTVAVVTAPPADAPATPVVVAYPIRPPSVLEMDGRDAAFPAAKLAVIGRGTQGFTLRLCSDDPPTAIDPGYAGNSYVLDMRMPADHLSKLADISWDYKAAETDGNGEIANSGIYLHNRDLYRPGDVHVAFQKEGDDLLVNINGTFWHTDSTIPGSPKQTVQVSGCLRTNLPR